MASGYWPVEDRDDIRRLLEAVKLIEEVLDENPCDDSQFDNAASDGGFRAELWLAVELIERSMDKGAARFYKESEASG